MTTPLHPSPHDLPVDADLAAQARPGYGVPSQDPRPEAQQPMAVDDAQRESKSVYVAGGAMAGAATGATIGVAVAGPVGVVVGGALGSVAGALGGAAAGGLEAPATENTDEAQRKAGS